MTHELEINGKQYLLVGVPKDACGFSIQMDFYESAQSPQYEPINTISYLTEEECVPLVEWGSYAGTWRNYITNDNHKSNQLRTAKASFISLLKSKGILAKSFAHIPDANDACYKTADGLIDVYTWAADYAKYNALPEELILIQRI